MVRVFLEQIVLFYFICTKYSFTGAVSFSLELFASEEDCSPVVLMWA